MYGELPIPQKTNSVSLLEIRANDTLGQCCVIEIAKWQPNLYGQVLRCNRCNNVFVTYDKKSPEAPVTKSIDSLGLKQTYKFNGDYVLASIIYFKDRWNSFQAEMDVEMMGVRKDGCSRLTNHDFYALVPASWLNKDSIYLVQLAHGKLGVIGKVVDEFKDKAATTEELNDEPTVNRWFDRIL